MRAAGEAKPEPSPEGRRGPSERGPTLRLCREAIPLTDPGGREWGRTGEAKPSRARGADAARASEADPQAEHSTDGPRRPR